MSLCIYCDKQKGKRSCPALGGLICSSCCGQHRGLRIRCPIGCKYFKAHENYQKERLSGDFHSEWLASTEPLYRQHKHKSIDLIARLEIAIFQHYRERTQGTDREISEALEFLKRQLSPLLIVEATATILGNELLKTLEEYVRREQLASGHAQEAVELMLSFVQRQIDLDNPRKYLHGLLGHVEKYFELPKDLKEAQSTIVKPSIVMPDQLS
jgi:hypothetical protein